MIGNTGNIIEIEDCLFRVLGDWKKLAPGDLYVGRRNNGYKLGICTKVVYRANCDYGSNPHFPGDGPEVRYTSWVNGDGLDGNFIYPYDLSEVSKVEMVD